MAITNNFEFPIYKIKEVEKRQICRGTQCGAKFCLCVQCENHLHLLCEPIWVHSLKDKLEL